MNSNNPFDASEIIRRSFQKIREQYPEITARDIEPIAIVMPRKLAELLKSDLETSHGTLEMLCEQDIDQFKSQAFREIVAIYKRFFPQKSVLQSLYLAAINASLAATKTEKTDA